ncbi:MAG TPA: sigma-54 dependent transcriptional regulator, partial [Candidatus Hydrogenedentes bacterium]|nr:sigma-54 dependent transcriptional regulator [Candidatus Hydrogenedentota bacterium]
MVESREKSSHAILVVDDKPSMRDLLEDVLRKRGLEVNTASNGTEAIAWLGKRHFAVVITDLSMPGEDGMAVLKAAKVIAPDTDVIMVTAYGSIERAVEAMRLGAHDFIAKPFKLAEIELKVTKLLRAKERATDSRGATSREQHLVGASAQTKDIIRMITRIAPGHSSVVITGPSGTGKELVARAIHEASPRRERPFIALNCAALASGVLESELFGHEKGAFTGATARRIGRFEQADTGTLFLDEVGDIDVGIQTKLLRVLQQGEFERVGGMETVRVNVRIVAATNRDLNQAIQNGTFREDFYYRLNVFSLHVPPLRERPDDIPTLIDHFLQIHSEDAGKEVNAIDDQVMEIFMRYPWPGNVRELQNVLERGVILAETSTITIDELPQEMLFHQEIPPPKPLVNDSASLIEKTDRLESELILGALNKFHWNKTKAAEHLGLKR